MGLTRADVEKIANLARLRITADEANAFAGQLADVLNYVETLNEIDTDGVEPLAHPIEQVNILADDVAQESYPRDTMLRNAPKRDEEYYRVPPVLGDD